ncbi:MAG: radical SAM protein [Aphanocapsa sp. GSE-SYN-MK-11-07L]|jgi:sulfatase maturation enzyme AslB (radical SAM superfamily)|nr:radical SAM protein [Aphanocapsa sp. GSE-SYN-MK-11-07L]
MISEVTSRPHKFTVYQPVYRLGERLERYYAISRTVTGALKVILKSRIHRLPHAAFGASIEITDRCNAGCNYCYVYPSEWTQTQRMAGYLNLSTHEHREQEKQVFATLARLHRQGIVHVTLIGGEPLLASKIIYKAAKLFPVVWVVTNGAAKHPVNLPRSVVMSVSIDGPPDLHNRTRDPSGFFAKQQYGYLTGMSAAIARNINESERGAFVHITLTQQSLSQFPATVDWLVTDLTKLRGIMVSGAATTSSDRSQALEIEDKQLIKQMIKDAADRYGWQLFPFNQPLVNSYLFDPEYVITNPAQCTVARRVDSIGFDGNIVGKCVLRDQTDCTTCACNLTGLMRAVSAQDKPSIAGLWRSCFG